MQGLGAGVRLLACAAVYWAVSWPAEALSMPAIFGDHMVLQQGKDLPVWGTAEPGESIRVRLGGRIERTVADAQGAWRVTFAPRTPGHSLTMRVTGEQASLEFEDVLIGEVWVCSGQSNMQWTLAKSNNALLEIERADYPQLRMFSVERTASATPQRDCVGSWQVCTPEHAPEFSAVGYFFGRELHGALDTPVGLIHTSWGGTPAESWTTLESLQADPLLSPIPARWEAQQAAEAKAKAEYEAAYAAWQAAVAAAQASGTEAPEAPTAPKTTNRDSWMPGGLYNAMIAPLVPYAIQGAIWYQGESNASRAYQYRTLFPTMIRDWRASWNQGDFPFIFVQLANYLARQPEPGDSAWAELREAQTMTLDACANTGQAVTIDIGHATDIHPRNKQEVGRRLALHALAKTYGRDVPYSGPVYNSMVVNGNAVTLSFEHAAYGLQTFDQGKLVGFAIAGADRKFVWADARIEGDTVVVSSDAVPEPVAVRYAWADNPECNLHNGIGLPASPFRTDDWPGVTVDAR